jgi:hypothetical protein
MSEPKKTLARGTEFKLNEPPKRHAGERRASVRVDAHEWPAVARRRALDRVVLAHDPDEGTRPALGPDDRVILRRMAMERDSAGSVPAARRSAIALLGRQATRGDLNFLTELFHQSAEPEVRAAALGALASTGMPLMVPLLREGLASPEPLVWQRAAVGLVGLRARLGPARFGRLLGEDLPAAARARLDEAQARVAGASSDRRAEPTVAPKD